MYNPRHQSLSHSMPRNGQLSPLGSPPAQKLSIASPSELMRMEEQDKENAGNDNIMSPIGTNGKEETDTQVNGKKVGTPNNEESTRSLASSGASESDSSVIGEVLDDGSVSSDDSSKDSSLFSTAELKLVLDECFEGSNVWAYGMLQLDPERVLNDTMSGRIPSLMQTRDAYYDFLALQYPDRGNRRLRGEARAFEDHYELFGIRNGGLHERNVDEQDAIAPNSSFQATQVRLATWKSETQRSAFLSQVNGDLWDRECNTLSMIEIPLATSSDKKMIDEVTSAEELASGGYKQIFGTGDDCVLLKYPGRRDDKDDLLVSQLCSGLSTVSPNFPRLHSTPVLDDRTDCMYATMPRFAINLFDYICGLNQDTLSDEGDDRTMALMSIGIQICFGVLAGQSVLGLVFSDLKSPNIMLDGEDTHKFYPVTLGSSVHIFKSVTEAGFGTVKLIDNSTTTVGAQIPSVLPFCPMTTLHLTPLDGFLLGGYVSGFHRDVHNIMLIIIEMFAFIAYRKLVRLEVPEGFKLTVEDRYLNDYPGVTNSCYQQLVLLSSPGECVLDLLSSDPTFNKSWTFRRTKAANKTLLGSKEFAKDVAAFSLLDGSEFAEMRDQLGRDKVELLWKGTAPSPALRPTLPAFMCAFFEECIVVVENPKENLRDWYDTNVGEGTEVVPLFLDESHVDIILGSDKDSFVLKSDEE